MPKRTILWVTPFLTKIALILVVLLTVAPGCSGDGYDFTIITNKFNSAKKAGVVKLELRPILEQGGMRKLSEMVTITNDVQTASILRELVFLETPQLPKSMEHSAGNAECKMVVYFKNGSTFSFYICFRDGPAGSGVEYAIYQSVNPDSLAHEDDLPGNHTLGRGYSIKLYNLLHTSIQADGQGWR